MARGRLITLEGIEGAGKSTHIEAICNRLKSLGIATLATREPGGTPIGESIRRLLLDPTESAVAPDTELLLIFAARAAHLTEVIEPALEAGQWVVSDRFTDATFAYQGGGRGISARRIAQLERWVQGERRPDLILVLDLAVDVGRARIGNREEDRFEREQSTFFQRVRETYLERARHAPERYRVIDASRPVEQVRAALLDELRGLLP